MWTAMLSMFSSNILIRPSVVSHTLLFYLFQATTYIMSDNVLHNILKDNTHTIPFMGAISSPQYWHLLRALQQGGLIAWFQLWLVRNKQGIEGESCSNDLPRSLISPYFKLFWKLLTCWIWFNGLNRYFCRTRNVISVMEKLGEFL